MLGKVPYYLANFVFTRCFTPRKFINLVRAAIEWSAKSEVLKAHPYYAMIDPCNTCTLHCPLCPTGKGEPGRQKGTLSFDDFKTVFDEMKDYLYEVYLYGWGEPFLNKDVLRMVRYAHDSRIRTRISSNLNYFREGFAAQIVDSGLDALLVALDGTTQESYQTYRRGGDFNKVVGNLKAIVAEKKRRHAKTPRLIWQFIAMKHNEKEIPDAREMARTLDIDELKITPMRTDASAYIFQSDAQRIDQGRQWLPDDQTLTWFDYEQKKRVDANKSCKFPWSMPVISPTGSVAPCCGVYPERFDFGNALADGFMTVWNNSRYVASRRLIAGRSSAANTVCANCLKNGFF